jgi:serine/threonine protein phosphatase 1
MPAAEETVRRDTMTGRRFAVPDIHGCADTFRRLAVQIALGAGDTLFILGDLIDRGPDSRGVLDEIVRLREEEVDVVALRGNHEEMLLDSCRDRDDFRLWMMNGGGATLASFAVEDACEIPRIYLELIASFPLYAETEGFVLAHAGLNFEIADPFADREAMLWVRSTEARPERIGGRRLVCGHTPTPREEIRRSLDHPKIVLDNGCVYRGYPGLGALAALELDTMELFFQENVDRSADRHDRWYS